MKIGIDIDGVLTDIEQWQLDYGSKFFYEKYGLKIKNYKGYETNEIFDVDIKLDDEFWNKYSNETLVFKCGAGTFRGRVNDQSTLLHYTNPIALVLDLKW